MKSVLTTSLILMSLIFSSGAQAAATTDSFNIDETNEILTLNFSPSNGANLKEFMEGRVLVNKTVATLIEKGFSPIHLNLSILISPVKMPGGMVVVEDQIVHLAVGVDPDLLERAILKFFDFKGLTVDGVSFTIANSANSDEFLLGRDIVMSVIEKIKETGFSMKNDHLEVAISPITMMGGDIIERNGKLIVSVGVNHDDLERVLLKYFEWLNN